jgi:hypothetical protein
MHRVGQREIDGIDLGETVIELVVGERPLEPITPRDLSTLGPIVTDHGDEPGIPTGMGEGRQHGHLRDVSESDDRIADYGPG